MSATTKLPKHYGWWTERERLAVVEWDDKPDCAVSPTSVSNGKKMRILVDRRAVDFDSDLSTVSEIPPQFHEALAYKVISQGYTRGDNPNIQMAQYFDMLYQKAVKDAKKYAKGRKVSTGFIKPVDF